MQKERMAAFSDGVFAVVITIMVLEMKPPHSPNLEALWALWPVFLAYVLSFIYIGIYWNNHHQLLHAATRVNGAILWANLALLFWLSLIPFTTAWAGDNPLAGAPVALYGVVLLACAISFLILQAVILKNEGPDSLLAKVIGSDLKGKISLSAYCLAIVLAFMAPKISLILYAFVATIWFIPDRRIARAWARHSDSTEDKPK